MTMSLRDTLSAINSRRKEAGAAYQEVLRSDSMSMGLYVLQADEEDKQTPHSEDEAYYVVSGRGRFTADGEDGEVGPGDILFVEKGVDHRFHSITDELRLLVFFAPAEATTKEGGA